jgi:hypothetical protein
LLLENEPNFVDKDAQLGVEFELEHGDTMPRILPVVKQEAKFSWKGCRNDVLVLPSMISRCIECSFSMISGGMGCSSLFWGRWGRKGSGFQCTSFLFFFFLSFFIFWLELSI